ncbi:MAG: HAMP domain-containing histidine kinase [Gallionellaceae bacterium]|nr:HAMP domain-containing histidine kinase [Gallionellaceae bacterium]
MDKEDLNFADFIASAVHDMKNSLNVQIGFMGELQAECSGKIGEPMSKRLGQVIYEANRMNSNLIQILSIYKLGKSIYPVDIADYSVKELIEEVVLQNQPMMVHKGITVSVDCDEDCYWYFDHDLVAGILINALNNAYNYTRDKIRIAAKAGDGVFEMRIEDNGTGYPESMLQGGVAKNKGVNFNSGSTGLGFYFSSRVAQMHKNGGKEGEIEIENGGAFGGGCFILRLP